MDDNNPTVIPKNGLEEHWGSEAIPETFTTHAFLPRLEDFDPGLQGLGDPEKAVSSARKVNDTMAELISNHLGRFAAFAALPTQDPDAAAIELERAVTEHGFKGRMIHGHTNGEYLDERKFCVLWERAEELGLPIYLHIANRPVDHLDIYKGHPELQGAAWHWNVEVATHALRIVCSGVFDDFPNATLILGHMGELLPYALKRVDEGYRSAKKMRELEKKPSDYIKENVLITTSGWYFPETMRCAIDAMGVDRVLFATDYPFRSMQEAVQHLENCSLSHMEKEKIYHLNA